MPPGRDRITLDYVAVLCLAFLTAVTVGWTPLATSIDRNAYDWLFRLHPPEPWPVETVVLAFDEETLSSIGGLAGVRSALARGLERLVPAAPRVVAIDILLADAVGGQADRELEIALAKSSNLVLPADLLPGGRWEDPLPRFRFVAEAVGHIHALPDPVSRWLPLAVAAGRQRRWALALEAYRLTQGGLPIQESPRDLTIGLQTIPAQSSDGFRALRIPYLPPNEDGSSRIPLLSFRSLLEQERAADICRGKTVFVGVTAQSAARDRLMVPYGYMMSGVEIHAHAFETLRRGRFLTSAPLLSVAVICLLLVVGAGLVFSFLSGWKAYAAGGALVLLAHLAPHLAFRLDIVLPYLAPVLSAWLAVAGAASWQHFVVRRQLQKSESDRARYVQTLHFVTHEMRSPLTAIQGSSELMGRYNLNEDKRRQMAQMINSESKRLARMIQTFLDLERLSDGQVEMRREVFPVSALLEACMDRARPLAERKNICFEAERIDGCAISGDRELMEYAVYNLLSNAVKYSDSGTVVSLAAIHEGSGLRLSVRDQGIGMDEKELPNIFKKFYRTGKAEASGEAGTGIGLSIVQQIVTHHGGSIGVTSKPGVGSCFTIVLPRAVMPEPEAD